MKDFVHDWRHFLELVARRQTEVLLALVYLVLVLPTSLVRRILFRPALLAAADLGWVASEDQRPEAHTDRMF